jgi:ABC-2 type transport system ATP-binding protein
VAEPVLRAQGLTKTYRSAFGRAGQQALLGLDVTVEAGTAFGLIGPNGAGKTTFIKCILGVVHPDGGSVRVLGGSPEDPSIRARIGYLPERLHLPSAWKPAAYLASVARLKGLPAKSVDFGALLGRVGLDAAARDRRIGGYSKGMKQRLGLAAALLGRPELLVLDEPTDGVDPLGRVEVRKILEEEVARGATLFLNSHLLAETERICDRVGILARGRLVREGPLETLTRAAAAYRLRFAPSALQPAQLIELGLEPAGGPDSFSFTAEDPVALNNVLDRARSLGALLLELTPASRDLEDVLADALKGVGTESAS